MAPTEWARASGDDELRKELGFGRSDGRRLLPEARVDEAAPHRGLVEELHVADCPARQDGEIAVVPLVVDAVEVRVEQQPRVLCPPHYDWQGVRRVVALVAPEMRPLRLRKIVRGEGPTLLFCRLIRPVAGHRHGNRHGSFCAHYQIPLQPQNAVQKHPFAAERLPHNASV